MTKRVLDTYEADRNYYVLECAIPPTPPPPLPCPLPSMVQLCGVLFVANASFSLQSASPYCREYS